MGFPTADVEGLELRSGGEEEERDRWLLTVTFFGLYGPSSPMPNHFSEEILWAGAEGEQLRDFLDLFHHRFTSFLFRAWEKYRYHLQYSQDGDDKFSRRILSLVGLGTDGMLEALAVPAPHLIRAAGLLRERGRTAAGLEGVLRDHFEGTGLTVESFVAHDAAIPADQLARLGSSACRLGTTACLGERIVDLGGSFRVAVGPLGAAEYRRFLPDGEALPRLARLTRFYVSDPLRFDVRLRLRAAEVPPLRLSPEAGFPLGWMSWIAPDGATEGSAVLSNRGVDPRQHPSPRPQPAPRAPAGPAASRNRQRGV
jgi:type VI secretion system protein ImpH